MADAAASAVRIEKKNEIEKKARKAERALPPAPLSSLAVSETKDARRSIADRVGLSARQPGEAFRGNRRQFCEIYHAVIAGKAVFQRQVFRSAAVGSHEGSHFEQGSSRAAGRSAVSLLTHVALCRKRASEEARPHRAPARNVYHHESLACRRGCLASVDSGTAASFRRRVPSHAPCDTGDSSRAVNVDTVRSCCGVSCKWLLTLHLRIRMVI